MDRRRGWVSATSVVAGLLAAAGSARAQGYGAGSGVGLSPYASPSMNPYLNPYLNPYTNPALFSAPQGGAKAAMMFMAGQQAMAGATQARAAAAAERDGRSHAMPRGVMNVPGGGAARYFGGGSVPVETAEVPAVRRGSPFPRQDRYFRPNGY